MTIGVFEVCELADQILLKLILFQGHPAVSFVFMLLWRGARGSVNLSGVYYLFGGDCAAWDLGWLRAYLVEAYVSLGELHSVRDLCSYLFS